MNLKSLWSVIAGLTCGFCATAAVAPDGGDVITLDSRASLHDCRPDEVIVKFKSSSRAAVRMRQNSPAPTGVSAVDAVMRRLGVSEAEALMPLTGSRTFARKQRGWNGREVSAAAFDKAYRLRISDATVAEAVEMLSALDDVAYAEPNYLMHALGAEGADDINDPYYSLQYGISEINLFKLWGAPVISKEGPVIAIIDTGVDTDHPDLAPNLWVNPSEANGASGYDDDRNGYVDDLHGYDFVNKSGALADYNGHGTHCAGIAAAVGRNGLGIIGANPDARIMALTALQSNGKGDVATIIKAIDYAAANGAQIISMSLGTYAPSMALEEALGRAYQTSLIVAAAGNDGLCLNHAHPKRGQMEPMPMFPAAYTFVLGVQASARGGSLAGFTNYDDDGPVFSQYSEEKLYNYELTAPGAGIMSTYPNGQYKSLNGTSMATPLVAGALSRLLQAKEYGSCEELFGDLINTSREGLLDVYAAYQLTDADRTPSLQIVGNRLADADGDGRPDAGEVLEFYPAIRNGWGYASDIRLTLECAEPVNTFCELLNGEADFGNDLSTYGKAESANPLRIRINDDVADGRICRLKLTASCPNGTTAEQEFEIKVENGVEIGGVIGKDMTLHAGVHYIVTTLLAVPEGVTLTIEPGAVIKFKDGTGINVSGTINAVGEPGNMITFTKADLDVGNIMALKFPSTNILEYCIFENLRVNVNGSSEQGIHGKNCLYRDNNSSYVMEGIYGEKCNIYNNIARTRCYGVSRNGNLVNCNILNNEQRNSSVGHFLFAEKSKLSNVFSNLYYEEKDLLSFAFYTTTPTVFTPVEPNYLGTADIQTAKSRVIDINYPGSGSVGEYDLSNMLLRPNPEAHGIVWKVVVDGYDAQDEFDKLPPLGVGRHKVEVYYSKVIDQSEAPTIAMGVRPPYTQTAISADGSWRTETLPYIQVGNGLGQTDVKNGDFNLPSTSYWTSEGCEKTCESGISWTGCDVNYLRSYKHQSGVTNKLYQEVKGAQNGRYKLTISANVDRLAENNDCQYVYLNDEKTYLDERALTGAVYEVIADVRNNRIEVGIAQTENIADWMRIDNVSLTLLEEYSNERMEPVSVYTAYLDITGKMDIDGVNRLYVSGGRDLEYFPIPLENTRFNVNVQAAGSLSTGFFGEAGLGRVNLTWEDLDMNFEDIMGYNMYRIDPEQAEAVKINERLIDAGTTTYTDYDVTPGQTYQYYYKVMTTDLKENEPSKIVAVTPLTSTLGDSNGSGSVDVADVLTTVNYASGLNPKPFIREAADVNADTEIDILDVVGTVNIIMGTPDRSMLMGANEATLSVEEGILYIDTPVELAGLQFDFTTEPERRIKVLPALDGFETTGAWKDEKSYRFMAYNLNGKTLGAGKHALLDIAGANVSDARLSDASGTNVKVIYSTFSGIDLIDKDSTLRANGREGLYNLMGVKVGTRSADLERLPAGIYILNGWKVVKR